MLKKFKEIFTSKNTITAFIFSSLKEILMIVISILLALYIDNWNDNEKYKKTIDTNIEKAYQELDKNIEYSKRVIERIYQKDSLIYLVMNDSVKADDYYKNIALPYLIINYFDLILEDRAYQNLIQISATDNKYRTDLLTQLKELYSINNVIKGHNDRMSYFVFDKTLPFLAKNISSFGDLSYNGVVKKDAVDFFMSSKEYKSIVSQYAIIALKNQLRYDQFFLSKAVNIANKINKIYGYNTHSRQDSTKSWEKYNGSYVNTELKDSISIVTEMDSLYIERKGIPKVLLIPIKGQRYMIDNEGGYFATFTTNPIDSNLFDIKVNVSSRKYEYKRIR